ncbi:hypothetical protein D9X30_2725 [Cupriavidus sp. U2]|uniref:chain-length determining protein n=1 Tax=Cupriavidus sp. U2 TaxID=2920269 RepID=UPI00129DC478|nr:chain-length determining protein [Cupriavidus sp. U2]KAI3592328.1 hypothetical protein D9X30_2725 [Cupriavidus sp. U2]
MDMKVAPAPGNNGDGVVITLEDVLGFFRRHAVRILSLSVVGLAIGICVTFVIPKQWEATGVLQIGQVANEATTVPVGPTQIEPIARALERLRIPQFTDAVLKNLGFAVGPDEDANAALIRRSLKTTILAGTDLIQYTVRGFSPQQAKQAAEAISVELIRVHAGLMRPSLERLKADLAEVRQGVDREDKRREMLSDLVRNQAQGGVAGKFSENVLLSEMVNENEKALRSLRLRSNTLQELMTTERTYNTHLLGPVETGRRYVYPRKSLFGVGGLVAGLLLSLLLGVAIDAKHRLKSRTGNI